jgi:hypothetical protein
MAQPASRINTVRETSFPLPAQWSVVPRANRVEEPSQCSLQARNRRVQQPEKWQDSSSAQQDALFQGCDRWSRPWMLRRNKAAIAFGESALFIVRCSIEMETSR